MKLLIKSLSILAIGGIFAGTALAGPGDAYLGSHAASVAKASAEKKTGIRHDLSVSTRSEIAWSESQVQLRRVSAGSSAENVWGWMTKSTASRHKVGAPDLRRQSMPDFLLSEPSNY